MSSNVPLATFNGTTGRIVQQPGIVIGSPVAWGAVDLRQMQKDVDTLKEDNAKLKEMLKTLVTCNMLLQNKIGQQ